MRTADLTGALLDYYVARAEGVPAEQLEIRPIQRSADSHCVRAMKYRGGAHCADVVMNYSTSWALTGPLLAKYAVFMRPTPAGWQSSAGPHPDKSWGDTPLIAICRAMVRAAFGDEVGDLP